MSFKPEVLCKGETNWAGNALRFETEREAELYVLNLFCRWTSVDKTRVVTVDEPATHRWVDDKLEEIVDAKAP